MNPSFPRIAMELTDQEIKEYFTPRDFAIGMIRFWLIWFINQRALYNHALSVIIGIGGIGIVSIIGIICAHLPLA